MSSSQRRSPSPRPPAQHAHGSSGSASSAHAHRVHKLLDELNLSKPMFKGQMYKQSHSHLGFNVRYFVLYPKILLYYDHERDFQRDLTRGNLQHRDKAILLEGVFLSKPEKKPKGARYCFVLHCPDHKNERHEMLLVTKSREERQKWMDMIQDQNPHLLSARHPIIRPDTPEPPRKRVPADTLRDKKTGDTGAITARDKTEETGVTIVVDPSDETPGAGAGAANGVGEGMGEKKPSFLDIEHLDIRDAASDVEDEGVDVI